MPLSAHFHSSSYEKISSRKSKLRWKNLDNFDRIDILHFSQRFIGFFVSKRRANFKNDIVVDSHKTLFENFYLLSDQVFKFYFSVYLKKLIFIIIQNFAILFFCNKSQSQNWKFYREIISKTYIYIIISNFSILFFIFYFN